MKFKASNVILGLCFIAVGILFYCKAFLGLDISIWNILWRFWPLFIVLPNISGILTGGFKMSSFVWLLIGIILLLLTNGLVSGSLIRKLIVPVALVLIGLALIFKDTLSGGGKQYEQEKQTQFYDDNFFSNDSTSQKKPEYNAIFSSTQVKYPKEFFHGTCINSVFGSVVLDLRDAIITEDVVIHASVIFAGADIYVPDNVNIKVSSIPIFGGVSNKTHTGNAGGPTIFINATCMFGGLDIK